MQIKNKIEYYSEQITEPNPDYEKKIKNEEKKMSKRWEICFLKYRRQYHVIPNTIIADFLESTLPKINSYLYRGRQLLKTYLEEDIYE